jgi:uncharacterized protein
MTTAPAAATPKPVISADSHVTEPPDTYAPRIDPRFRDRAPRVVRHDQLGDVFVIDGMRNPLPLGLVAAAGKPAEEIRIAGTRFEELHRGGWDPKARLEDQARDGVAAEIIYPTVGMVLCNHPDLEYKKACMDAYNLWLAEYCSAAPGRLFGCGQTAVRSVDEAVEDLRRIRALGLRGVMMPGLPGFEDYDHPDYDALWQAAIDLDLPLSFHILTTSGDQGALGGRVRGPRLNGFLSIIRSCQDVMGTFVLSGVFEREPRLRVVCVEADAGWVPHYMYRMDHAFERHRHWLPAGALSRPPSEYFRENVYVTFQDDWVAFQVLHLCNPHRLLWASDFPHSDSTWPRSQEILREQTASLTGEQRDWILHDNVAALYGLDVH